MKKTLTVLAILAGVSLVGSVAFANYGDLNKIFGYVKQEGTLIPINKAKVRLYSEGGTKKGSDTTDKRGYYYFKRLSEKKYVVKVTVEGYHDPKNVKKNTITATVKADGPKKKNFYFAK